ncbi:hypothetical protein [Emticicia sp. 17c]
MKKILTIIVLLSCAIATLATPDPKKKNLKKVRVDGKTISVPTPPKKRI